MLWVVSFEAIGGTDDEFEALVCVFEFCLTLNQPDLAYVVSLL